jgi:hypothetical protein
MWFRQITKYFTMYVTKNYANPHSTKQYTLPIAFQINKQVVLYRTRGGTCCPGVFITKIWSSADSSTTYHDGINHLHHSNHCSNYIIDSYTVNLHLNGWKTITFSQRHKPTQYHKGWKTCTTLMMAWLSITNQEWTHIPKVWGLGNNTKTCRPICELEREST